MQISATATESFMFGKDVTDPDTLTGALKALSDEIAPNLPPAAASVTYRKNLALSLFYKVIIIKLSPSISTMISNCAYDVVLLGYIG